jgi:DNA-binding NarL/FixJ family response regulator
LDACIEKRSSFEEIKKQRIEHLEGQFFREKVSLANQYQLSAALFNEYCSYKYDSAYTYAGRMLQFAERIKDPNLIAESKMNLAFSCVSAGLYKEASEIYNSIDSTQLNLKYRADFYSFLSTLYIDMADFSTEPYSTTYRKSSLRYCNNSMGLYPKKSPEWIMANIRECQLEDNYSKAIIIAEHFLKAGNPGLHDYAIVASTLGYFYQTRRDTTQAIEYFSAAAIADLKMATKETSAIRQLAELLYLQGDVQRAYSYDILALDDANFYNARQRKIEVGRVLPIIEAGRFEIIKQQKDKLLIYAAIISILFILFMVSTLIILKQKKRLNSARLIILKQNTDLLESNEQLKEAQKKLSKQNIDLVHINERLKEVHRIKDEYIGYFFSTNSAYLDKTEDFRKMVVRKIRNRQFDELMELSAVTDLRKEREDMFELFDQIFIKLFPDFVTRYNQLFNQEDRILIKPGGMLTPELRIFALIRLGITESERIASFLDFSLSTVKNYKTKAKNRSIIPNDLFEHKIMEIESVKTDIPEKTD